MTNHFRLSPKTVADICKERWKIELFFREIKQNPRIKSFAGNSENAVLIQLYTALAVHLLLAYQKFLSRLGLSVQQLFQLIQLNLLGAASLEGLLNPRRRKNENPYNLSLLEHFTNEMSELLCKDLSSNPCRERGVGGSRTQALCLARR